MKLDALLAASGAVKDVEIEELPAYLKARATDFLIAGGSLSLSDFAALSEESKAAFVEAGEDLIEYRAGVLASAVLERLSESAEEAAEESSDDGADKALEAMMGAVS